MATDDIGLNAVIRGVGQYIANANLMSKANAGLVASVTKVENATLSAPRSLSKMAFFLGRLQFVAISTAAALAAIATPVTFAAKFESQFARIAGLTQIPRDAVQGLRKDVLALSKELGKSPDELGAGAYFILSSGIKSAATATEILSLSAKASAVGLGNTQDIARSVTSVMNAYHLSLADAAKVTDEFVQIVKLGSGEPAELAQHIGEVTPIAAAMGVSLEQLGAILITLTNNGLDTATAVTDLKGIFNQLLSPSEFSKKVFKELNIDIAQFRKEVDENAVAALQHLIKATNGSEAVLAALFPDIRGLTGIISAFSLSGEQTSEALDGVTNSSHALDNAFEIVSNTTEFKFHKAVSNLQVSLINLGTTLLPTATKALEGFSHVIDKISTRGPEIFRDWVPVLQEMGREIQIAGGAIQDFGNWILDNKPLIIVAIGLIAFAFFEVFGPLGIILVGVPAAITVLSLFKSDLDDLGVTALQLRLKMLQLADSFVLALKEGQHFVFGGDLFGKAANIPGLPDQAKLTLQAASDLQKGLAKIIPEHSRLSDADAELKRQIDEVNNALNEEIVATTIFPQILESLRNGTLTLSSAVKLYGDQLTAAQLVQLSFASAGLNSVDTFTKISGAATAAGLTVDEFTLKMLNSISVQQTFAATWANTSAAFGLTSSKGLQDAIGQIESLKNSLLKPSSAAADTAGQALIDSLRDGAAKAAKEQNPFEALVKAEQVKDIIMKAAIEGNIAWSDVARLWDLGAHDAAMDFAHFMRGEISDISGEIDKSFKVVANRWMDSVQQGILDGTVDVLDALDFLEHGMIDAARSIVEGMSKQADNMAEAWQILAKTIEAGLVDLRDVNRLFEIGQPDSAREFLAFLAGRPSVLNDLIRNFKTTRISSIFPSLQGLQGGGFIPPGPPVPALLHGPEVVIPLGSQSSMLNALNRISGAFSGGVGGEFRNYGQVSIISSNSDSKILRRMSSALGVS